MPELTVTAPAGAHFAFEEVKTAKGAESLGEVPILVWDSLSAAVTNFGEEGVCDVLDGTSLRVSYQGIARRLKGSGKSNDEIAQAQADFKPGKRAVGQSTPTSRARNSAARAADKVDGDLIAALMDKIAKGEISAQDVAALTA